MLSVITLSRVGFSAKADLVAEHFFSSLRMAASELEQKGRKS